MAVDAVASVVIQKLTDMLKEEPVVFDKVIDQVEDIRIKLRQMRGFLIGAEEKPDDRRVKKWANDCLVILYDVEDMVEMFALGIVRRRQRWTTRWARFNHCTDLCFFFNNLKACRKLRRKLALRGFEINNLSREKPKTIRDSSFKYTNIGRGESFDFLMVCYNSLPAHSKLCLLYLVLFPEGFDIPVRRLIRLWLAEGFVKWSPPMAPEDVAMEYFEYLVEKKMLQITKLRSDGSPRRCRLQDKLHGMLLPKTKDIGLFHVHDNRNQTQDNSVGEGEDAEASSNGESIVELGESCPIESTGRHVFRRIIEYGDVKNCSVYSFSQLQNLRSYISFGPQKKDIPAREVADFVRKMTGARGYGLLRVLDLERVYKPSLPDDLGDLFHLRYLGLRWTFSESLPQSVGDLPHLETLDLKRTYINNLPNSIWKLKHLRHLNLNDIRLDMPQHSRSPMTQLLTLWGLVIDDNSRIRNGLNRLNDLRELGITFNLKDSGDLADWISNLTGLQSLRLLSKEESGRPSQLQLKSLSRLVKLSHLKLLGQLQKLPEKREFPPGLKVLTLSVSGLSDDPMPTLGQLQSLTVLRLLANSYRGKRMVCPIRGFPQLRVLKLWMLKELEEWEVKEGAMQNLKELNIRCCDKLSKLPTCLLSTLKELTLTNMPQPFVDEVRKISKHISIDNKQLDFSPLPWEEEDVFGRVQDGSQCDATTQKFHF